jgi:hypothetical protein
VFNKLITLMMVFAIFTTSAFAGSQNGLKAAFDELNYSLNVEWDQQDKEIYTAQMKKFTATIRELQAAGLSSNEIVEFAKAQVKDEKIARDIEVAFNMISINKMNSADATKYMVETMKNSYSTGANWNGNNVVYGVLVAAVVVAIVVAAATGNLTVVGGGGYYGCPYGRYYVCDTYYDWYYGYYYDSCYYTCY